MRNKGKSLKFWLLLQMRLQMVHIFFNKLKQLNDKTETADGRIQKLNDTVKTADARLQKLEGNVEMHKLGT